jgi:hypothetical protein
MPSVTSLAICAMETRLDSSIVTVSTQRQSATLPRRVVLYSVFLVGLGCMRPPARNAAPSAPTPRAPPPKPHHDFRPVQSAFDASEWADAKRLAAEFMNRHCHEVVNADRSAGSICYAAQLIIARSEMNLGRVCLALTAYDTLEPAPRSPEWHEFRTLRAGFEQTLRQRSVEKQLPFRFSVVIQDPERLELTSSQLWIDWQPMAGQVTEYSIAQGCHVLKLKLELRGRAGLHRNRFLVVGSQAFDTDPSGQLRAIVYLRDGYFPRLRFEPEGSPGTR